MDASEVSPEVVTLWVSQEQYDMMNKQIELEC